jgi:acyl-CoA-binding protein
VFLPPERMADAIEENITRADNLWNLYKQGIYVDSDGNRKDLKDLDASGKKKYEKKIKINFAKKIAIKQYVKLLRGKVKNMPVGNPK